MAEPNVCVGLAASRDQADWDLAAADPMDKGDASLARHMRQETAAFDGREMRDQHEMASLGRTAGSTATTIGNTVSCRDRADEGRDRQPCRFQACHA
jgi:hypothetical protein